MKNKNPIYIKPEIKKHSVDEITKIWNLEMFGLIYPAVSDPEVCRL
ncbi:MAG: hypothetical protein KKH08_00415 [Candidatus Omnitrophica bacterium]|nr:hypothetical protein [Candidatus Omnitrophota bacterium]